MTDLNVDRALTHVEILRVNRAAPFLFPVKLRSNVGPESGRVLNRPFVHFEILQRREANPTELMLQVPNKPR